MIADKVLPCFYLLEVEGKAIEALIPGDYGIHKIVAGSLNFPNDIQAIDGLKTAVQVIMSRVDADDVVEKIEYNPEFFPTLAPLELTEEQKLKIERTEAAVEELQEKLGSNSIAVPITNIFDPLGDFIEAKWSITATDIHVEGKVAVAPEQYLLEKQREQTTKYTNATIVIH